ncbi:MAG TPA: hypothetical protein VKC57_16860, partial [Ktedonobacterales bacterium]|nr:hypothetical protein [Ktedonobacterales bacterium]
MAEQQAAQAHADAQAQRLMVGAEHDLRAAEAGQAEARTSAQAAFDTARAQHTAAVEAFRALEAAFQRGGSAETQLRTQLEARVAAYRADEARAPVQQARARLVALDRALAPERAQVAAAQAHVRQVAARSQDLQAQIARVQARLDVLSAAEREKRAATGPPTQQLVRDMTDEERAAFYAERDAKTKAASREAARLA